MEGKNYVFVKERAQLWEILKVGRNNTAGWATATGRILDSENDYLTTFEDFMIIPIKHLENGGRSERYSGGERSSTSET